MPLTGMAAEPHFRELHLKCPERPDRRWLEWVREEFARRFFRKDLQVGDDFKFEHRIRALPGLLINDNISSASRHWNLPNLANDDDLTLVVARQGRFGMTVGGEDFVLGGDHGAVLMASDAPASSIIEESAGILLVKIGRRLIEPLLPRSKNLVGLGIPAGSQGLRLLTSYIASLDEEESFATPESAHVVATHLRDLAAMAIGPTRDGLEMGRGGARAARFSALKADILAHLTHRDLTIDRLATRHGITPRYVGSLFSEGGTTFTDFVLEQRLAHAHRMLVDPRFAGRIISAIALDSGFGDLSYFNQAFKRRYGMTPSAVRAGAENAA